VIQTPIPALVPVDKPLDGFNVAVGEVDVHVLPLLVACEADNEADDVVIDGSCVVDIVVAVSTLVCMVVSELALLVEVSFPSE
jgi:hypothetical protein